MELHAADDSARIICHTHTRNNQTGEFVDITVDAAMRSVIVAHGRGTVERAQLIVHLIDAMHDELGRDAVITGLIDGRSLQGIPLRAQALILKRVMTGRRQLGRSAIVGNIGSFEAGVARSILGITGLGSRTLLCQDLSRAVAFLGWPAWRYHGPEQVQSGLVHSAH